MDKKVKINELLKRGVEQIIVKDSLIKKLNSGKSLRIKLGVDPTAPRFHLGHTVVLRKLKQFQDLGHQVIFLVGDFTARIGDPSNKLSARKPLEKKDIQKNIETYKEQVGKVLDLSKVEFRHNSEWHQDMDFAELFGLASLFTVNQMLERDMFQERMKKKKPLWIHELLYPILQGYDSVALQADVELGGTDQTFNMLTARTIQPKYSQNSQDIMTAQLLEGTDGKEKMSMSVGNTIDLMDSSQEMFGKVMSIIDQLIIKYFTLLTDVLIEEINDFSKALKRGENPRDYKTKLALELVSMYHGKKEAGYSSGKGI
jgi:tyrosyl-tRNA synthetase